MIVSAIFDAIGVASILPFITVLMNPDIIYDNKYLYTMFNFFQFSDSNSFLVFLGLICFFILISSLLVKCLNMVLQSRFAIMKEYHLSKRLFELYLSQNYSWFLKNNTSEIEKTILSETTAVVHGALLQFMNLLSQLIALIFLCFLLFMISPSVAFTILIIFAALYFTVFRFVRNILQQLGKIKMTANEKRFAATQNAFGGFKEIKVNAKERFFLDRFSISAEQYADNLSKAHAINLSPRYFIEAFAFGSLLLVIIVNILYLNDLSSIIPVISVFAFAAYRLLPSINQIFYGLTQIKFNSPAVNYISNELKKLSLTRNHGADWAETQFGSDIRFNNVSFCYSDSNKNILEDVNFTIKFGSTVGVVGESGAGKSTIISLILGLLEPTSGEIFAGDKPLKLDVSEMHPNSIGYVSQDPFIVSAPIVENIAFGVDINQVNWTKVFDVAMKANLSDSLMARLKKEFEQESRGQFLGYSGGERQRLGIARALYREPSILILDEVTSSLDDENEEKILETINALNELGITIILVAHRLNTLVNCTQVLELKAGKIKEHNTSGQYKASRKKTI